MARTGGDFYLCILCGFVRGTKFSDESHRIIPHICFLQYGRRKTLYMADSRCFDRGCRIDRDTGRFFLSVFCCGVCNPVDTAYDPYCIWTAKAAPDGSADRAQLVGGFYFKWCCDCCGTVVRNKESYDLCGNPCADHFRGACPYAAEKPAGIKRKDEGGGIASWKACFLPRFV